MTQKKSPLQQHPLFGALPLALSEHIRGINPWWRGEPGKPPLAFRRWPFQRLKRLLTGGLTPAVVLRGPRRVGKTELLRQIIGDLLKEGNVTTSRRGT